VRQSIRNSWFRISPYIDEALDLEPNKRDAWLADLQTCAPRLAASLRTHLIELEKLKAQNFLEVAIPAYIVMTSLTGDRCLTNGLDANHPPASEV
jgi:hypothetical protein